MRKVGLILDIVQGQGAGKFTVASLETSTECHAASQSPS